MSGGMLKERVDGSEEERISYRDSELNEEAVENYCKKYGVFPTPKELERYIRTGEEFRDARTRERCLA